MRRFARFEASRLKVGRALGRRPTVSLAAVLLVASVTMLPTSTIAPIAWQDDSQITDFGRVLLSGDRSFGLSLAASGGAGIPPVVLGPLLSEVLFQIGGHSAVRVGSILLAAISALLLFAIGYRSGRHSARLPMLIALVFFFSYSFAQNYRSGRFDVLAFALLFAAVLLLTPEEGEEGLPAGRIALSSTLLGLSVITWPTAMLLSPLWLLVLLQAHSAETRRRLGLSRALASIFAPLAAVGGSALFLLAARGFGLRDLAAAGSGGMLGANLSHTHAIALFARNLAPDILFVAIPLVAVALGSARRRAGSWVGALGVVAVGVVLTTPYIHRYVYFLAAAALASTLLVTDLLPRAQRELAIVLTLLVSVLASLQLLVRPALALQDLENRSAVALEAAVAAIDCSRGQRVYLDTFRLYYTLRQDGCRMDRLSGGRTDAEAFLIDAHGTYDYIVLSGTRADWTDLEEALTDAIWQVFERGGGSQYRAPTVIFARVASP